ncbi:AMP-binding protein [Tenggerimyces flavus]|uniref:AMP-binding protein n=1 Tax=Tenggerimyces flavus TaxID=1708749 RepID=A0ABV7Y6B3_9ACTN|nr:AMP-binding protein [Tenggerimyces flavus]MBM7791278.1 long-chain acyl-CoA synthetase [Tenggerimyces flavus]
MVSPAVVQTVAVNLADLVRQAAKDAPERAALIAGDRRVTWSELDRAVDALAAGLAAQGVVAGHRVAVALPNGIDLVTAMFATVRAGLVVVPLNPESPTAEYARALEHVRPRLVLAGPGSVEAVRSAVATLSSSDGDGPRPVVVAVDAPAQAGELAYASLPGSGPAAVPPRDPEALAALLFTSGTSSAPRAAMLTHRALLANVAQMASIEPPAMRANDVVLGLLPLFHVFGLSLLALCARAGATMVLAGRFDPEATLDLVASEKVTNIPVAPPVFVAWQSFPDLAARLASVRLLLSGAAPLPIAVADAIKASSGLMVHEGYGLTEAAPGVTSTLCSASPKAGSVGAPLPGVEVRVQVDPGAEDADEPGEILVRGANLFSGYWPDGVDGPSSDGWLATGDVGYLDADGDLYLVDRVKELVLVSGFNVYPREVEDVIASFPGVSSVAVIGVPDERTGESVKAYVVPAAGASVIPEDVLAFARDRLARFKCPAAVAIVEELPRSVAGKIAKARLRLAEREASLGF